MKNFLAFFLLIMAIVACDKVKHPDQRPPVVYHCTDSATTVVNTNTLISNFRKVLVEDYTGHRCPNCPPAAVKAEDLISTYHNSVVVIANHVTKQFAAPQFGDSLYKEDFRNPTSTVWDEPKNFAISASGLPKGMVNRQKPYAQSINAWASLVPQILSKPQSAKMEMVTMYDTKSHYLTVKVKTTFKTSLANNVNLMIVLTQDSIVSDQEDNSPPADADIDPFDPIRRINYRFDHIVIGSVNDPTGGWGQLVKAAPIAANDTVTILNECFLVEKCFFNKGSKPPVCINDRHVNVVAFVYDVLTNEVLQVEKLPIR
jgi:hypothetical protein